MIGEKLKQARLVSNISQEELAKKLNISLFKYKEYEDNTINIGIATLMYIAKALNVKISYFFNNE